MIMYSLGDSPPSGKQLPFYVGVVMVTSGGLVALTLILAACSFFRKLRGGGGGHGGQSEMYVEEFYSNPAFMELPFDGSCSKPQDITYDTSVTEINHQAKEIPASSHSPPNGSVTSPQIVVAKTPAPLAYQEEPQYYVQENGHAGMEKNDVNSAIETKNSKFEKQLSGDRVKGAEETFGNGIVPAETVIVNPGALESFKKDEKGCYEVRVKENLETDDEHVKEFDGERSNLNVVNSHEREHDRLASSEMDRNEGVKQGYDGVVRKEETEGKVEEERNFCGAKDEGDVNRKEDDEIKGSLNKRVRTSIDDSYISRQNGMTIQQVKKPKMSSEELPADYSAKRKGTGKKGSGVYRKRSKSSFSKVQKPVFRNRRKITQTEDKLAAEVIKNPFTD